METSLSLNQWMGRIGQGSASSANRQSATDGGAGKPEKAAPRVDPVDAEALESRMREIAERLQEFVRENRRQLEFQVNSDSGDVVILVRHAESGEVLRSIPPEEARGLAERMDREQGALLSRRA